MSAISIARWLLDEASSGQVPTTVADDTGNGNDLAIEYNTSDANWTSNLAGNGWEITAAVNTSIAKSYLSDVVTTGNIGVSLDGVTQASIIVATDNLTGGAAKSRLFYLGAGVGDGEVVLVVSDTVLEVRWGYGSGGGRYTYGLPTGFNVIIVVYDTTEADEANRIKVYFNNIQQTRITELTPIPLNFAISTNSTTVNIALGNRSPPDDHNIAGEIYYAELFTGLLTADQRTQAYDNLLIDNDSEWSPVIPAAISAIGKTINPTIISSSVSATPTASTALGGTVEPTVIIGSILLTPASVSSIAKVIDPSVLVGGVTVSPASVYAIGNTINPLVEQSSLNVTPSPVHAIGVTINPAVTPGGAVLVTPSAVSSVGEVIDPLVVQSSVIAIPTEVTSISTVVNPTVVISGGVVLSNMPLMFGTNF